MSRIQTPTVTVNPNVEMANREAPTIVYQPEPYVPETYFDYEQLSNVLGAGVQAAKTFLDVETRAAEQARQNEILQFKTGLSQARLKATQIAEETGSYTAQPVKDFLSTYDYENSIGEIKIMMNSEWEGISEYNIESEQKRQELIRKNNTDVLSAQFQFKLNTLIENFDNYDTASQQTLLKLANDPEALLNTVISQFDNETLARWNSIETVDRDALTKTLADNVNRATNDLRKKDKEVRDRETASKVVALDSVRTGSLLQTAFMSPPGDGGGPMRTMEDEYQIYAAARMELDRTITEDKIVDDWTNMVRNATIMVSDDPNTTPEQVKRMRDVVFDDPRIKGPTRDTILKSLDTTIDKKIANKYDPAVDMAVFNNDIQKLDYLHDSLVADPLASAERKGNLLIKIQGAYKQIATKNRQKALDLIVATTRSKMEDRTLTERELLDVQSEMMNKMAEMNEVTNGRNHVLTTPDGPVTIEDTGSMFKRADDAIDDLRRRNESLIRSDQTVQRQDIENTLITEAMNGKFDAKRIMQEVAVFPTDDKEKILSSMNDWFKTSYLPSVQQALIQKYKLPVWDVPAGQPYPGDPVQRDRAHAEFTALQVYWANVGGGKDYGERIRQDLYGSLLSQMETTGASPALKDALSIYRMRMTIGRDQTLKLFGGNDQAEEYMKILAEVDSSTRMGMDINEAFKDATQRYRMDPLRTEVMSRPGASDLEKIEVALQETLDGFEGQAIQDSYPLVRHVFLKAALMEAPQYATADERITLAQEAVQAQLSARDNSILPAADLARLNQGPTFVSVAIEYLTGIEDAAAVAVDFDPNTGEYIYALRNSSGNSIATRDFPEMSELSNRRTFTLSDLQNKKLNEAVVAETPNSMKRVKERADQKFRDKMMRTGGKPGFVDVFGGP